MRVPWSALWSGMRRFTLAALTLISAFPDAVAQALPEKPAWLVRRANVYIVTRERWRGIRRNAYPLLQGDVVAGLKLGRLSLTAGGYGAVELGDTRDEPRPDLRAGTLGFSTATVWGQLAATSGGLTVSAGAIRDWYRRVGDDPVVSEIYTTARWQRGRWTSSVSYWHVVKGADGAYLEPAVAFHHFINPFTGPVVAWSTTLLAGFQIDQRDPGGGPAVPGPEDTGLTHVMLASTVRAAVPMFANFSLLLDLGPHLQWGIDPAARRRRDGSEAAQLALWWPLQIGVSYPLRRPE